MHAYQNQAVHWSLDRLFSRDMLGVGLLLDPGLGKTRIALTVLSHLFEMNEIKRALIIAPLRPTYSVWPLQIDEWGFPFSYINLHGQHKQAMRENCQVEIINRESLHHVCDIENRWDILVVDEVTSFKTWSAVRTKRLRKMLPSIPKRLTLTGTPAANCLGDLFSQIFVVDQGEALGKTVTYFRELYMMRGGWQGRQWIMRKDMQTQLLERINEKVLRMDAETYLDMPKLVKNDIWCTLPPDCLKQYKKLKRELYLELASGQVYATCNAAAYTKCRQFANGNVYSTDPETGETSTHTVHKQKLEALKDLAEELAGKPLLCFYQFKHDIAHIQTDPLFKKAPVIRGGMKAKEVDQILADWNKGKHRFLFAQCQTVSHGLNMQYACNDVCYYGLPDPPEVYDQSFRRVYRQGVQGLQVRIHRILMKGTVDEPILARLTGKGQTQDEFLKALQKHAGT